jgi:RNA polymerase sigma-70 factor (ECF subfamily)
MKEKYFRELTSTHYKQVYKLCLRYFGNAADASDAVQDVFIKVWNNLDRFRGESSPGTWIFRIATNVCLSALRNSKPGMILNNQPIPDTTSTEEDSEELNNQETQEKKISFFNEYLKTLNPVDRSIVNLYLEDFDSKMIAEITGLTDTNIRTRIHRIKSGIKKEWEERYGTR